MARSAGGVAGESPDDEQVVRLYARLLAVWDSPAVALNAAAALGLARGPAAGLVALDRLNGDPVLPAGTRVVAVAGAGCGADSARSGAPAHCPGATSPLS